MKATLSPSPCPIIAEVGLSISLIPGPPFGPSNRITTTSPSEIFFSRIAVIPSSSELKTFAFPVNRVPSLPVIFATAPSGAKFPYSTLKWLEFFTGLDNGRIIFWPLGYEETSSRFSSKVFPVTVRQSPCSKPCSSINFIIGAIPPIALSSDIKCIPKGLISAKTGVTFPMRVKSSRSRSTPIEWAIARRCKTAFVEPPNAITTAIEFSKAFFVIMSLGFISRSNKFLIAAPAFRQSCFLSFETAS